MDTNYMRAYDKKVKRIFVIGFTFWLFFLGLAYAATYTMNLTGAAIAMCAGCQ